MVSKSSGSDVAVRATQNVEDDLLLDRSVETDPEIQSFTDCGNDVMEVSVNAEEAVLDPPSIQVLPPVSTVIGAILKEEIRETLTVPICVESVKSGTFEGNRSGVPGGNEEGSVVSSDSVCISSHNVESEEVDPTVVSSPKKRSWKRLARINHARTPTDSVQLGKRSINFGADENEQSRKRGGTSGDSRVHSDSTSPDCFTSLPGIVFLSGGKGK
ncbi:hypothetical protein ACOSQ4_030924 [Xanthoceras sorbifolium]